jgi:hypothetical protein
MREKYENLGKDPQEDARSVGEVEKSNYLAHTIREIELALLMAKHIHYRIVVYASTTKNTVAKIHFSDQCSIICLPSDCEEMHDKLIRFTLAHELGHLIYNFDNLKNPEILDNRESTDEEEKYAWEFAFFLIKMKSEEHKNNIQHDKYVYTDGELKRSLLELVKKNKPEIYDDLAKSLDLPK